MSPVDICRTCAQQTNNLLALSSCVEKYDNKSISDMLQELTQNDPMECVAADLPQFLCADCLHKLQDAYGFVLQARQVQAQLLLKLRKELLTSQCLDEIPIDITMRPIKTEVVNDFDGEAKSAVGLDAVGASVSVASLYLKPESESEGNQVEFKASEDEDSPKMQLRRSARKLVKLAADSENEEVGPASLNPKPTKRRRGRPPKGQAKNGEGRFACETCGKTFSWHRDMQRHARMHYEKAIYRCESCEKSFLRKDKYLFHLRLHEKRQAKRQALQMNQEWRFAERLYSSGRLKRVECKLCGLKCQRIEELLEHLSTHTTVESLSNLCEDSEVIKEQFASHQDLAQIKQQVCAEIAEGREHWEKYCSVVNAHGYELCLCDSDEERSGLAPPYTCILCSLPFARKYRLIKHTLEEHAQSTDEARWQRCNACQIGFVCAKFLEQHQRTQCYSQFKRYSCSNCPGKFIWQQNLEQHACCQTKNMSGEKDCQQFLCCLCDENLKSMSSLRSHLLTHRDGFTGIDQNHTATFFRCFYSDGLDCTLTELSTRIANDFAAQDYGRYFNACTTAGQELDFFGSDKDLSDMEKSPLELHTCDLCAETTTSLSQLQHHQEAQHGELETYLPHVCEICDVGFVSKSLLQRHRRTVCCKQHAHFSCSKCNLRFVWESNYEQHMKLAHKLASKEDTEEELEEICRERSKRIAKTSSDKLQCGECEKVFIWPKDLTRHKRIHQPQAKAQYECSYCHRKFYRKDGLKSHMRVHGERHELERKTEALNNCETSDTQPMPTVLAQLCRPNGCRQIRCMICLSQHTKISDLRAHIVSHQREVHFVEERAKPESIRSICRALYPELGACGLKKEHLIQRIQFDIANGVELERFVSITNEAGIELSLDSSETETDSDSAETTGRSSCRQTLSYSCDLCQVKVARKHQLYAHQFERHAWEEPSLVCTHCQARFVNEQLLEHHYRTLCRNAQKRFLCRKCPLRFRWRDNLKLHMDVTHREAVGKEKLMAGVSLSGARMLPVVSYDCKECTRSFKMQKDLTRHTLMHAQESSIYRCRWCARRFYREANLIQHIDRHGLNASQLPYAEVLLNASRHPNGPKCIQCKVCNLQFATIATLRSHLLSAPSGTHHDVGSMLNYSITNQLGYELHLDDSETDEEAKPPGVPAHYTCGMCQLRCVRKYELHQHQQAMHRLERIPQGCPQCIFKSVSPDLIAYHQRVQCGNTEKQFKCAKCGYRFMWESNLLMHMQLEHSSGVMQGMLEAVSSTGESTEGQSFQCGQCTRKYNRKDRLAAHVKKCHASGAAESTRSTAKASSVSKQAKSFLCAFCGKAVSSSSNLIIHIRRHTGEKPFKCEFCEMAFPRSSDLQCHRRTHTGERPHVCTVCQRGFARSYKLQQHMRIHNGERPYKCTYCDKSFTQSNDLTLHIRRHTGERPYHCNICGERFIQGTALKNHRHQTGHEEAPEN
ncbi:hypothetical protein KR222_011147 [Zaprionus bogoriensis]|nr:hypothetical protein KR222_011147 [Zaprionus bogoriensis]